MPHAFVCPNPHLNASHQAVTPSDLWRPVICIRNQFYLAQEGLCGPRGHSGTLRMEQSGWWVPSMAFPVVCIKKLGLEEK